MAMTMEEDGRDFDGPRSACSHQLFPGTTDAVLLKKGQRAGVSVIAPAAFDLCGRPFYFYASVAGDQASACGNGPASRSLDAEMAA